MFLPSILPFLLVALPSTLTSAATVHPAKQPQNRQHDIRGSTPGAEAAASAVEAEANLIPATSIKATNNADPAVDADFDAIVIGGGPAGLSALSGLARVRRRALLVDSGEYRNEATRHMHDVIGVDGVTPAYFRWLAREKLSYYLTVELRNGTVTDISPLQFPLSLPNSSSSSSSSSTNPTLNSPSSSNNTTTSSPLYTVTISLPDSTSLIVTTRSIVLATGLTDLIPTSPAGLLTNWGKGIYWCPWCDGNEHADQPLGLIAPISEIPSMVREISTLNSDIIAFVNGTDTPSARQEANTSFPGWETYLCVNNVSVYNSTLVEITRLSTGSLEEGQEHHDPFAPTYPEDDLFRVDLADSTSLTRAAFFTRFPNRQRSHLGEKLGVDVQGGRLAGAQGKGYLTNVPLVYAVGDINTDNATNVPHAMYSGKKAAVYLHVALARLEAAAEIAAGTTAQGLNATTPTSRVAKRRYTDKQRLLDHRAVWNVMNGAKRDDVFYAGEFDAPPF